MANSYGNNGWADVAAAAINAGGQIAATAARSRKQWKYQQRAMDKQQALNIEAWNMQNAYNTPAQQMERLKDAGLNPKLIYGDGANAPNMAGNLDPADAPVREAPDYAQGVNPVMQYLGIRQMDAQYRNTVASTQAMESASALRDIQQALSSLNLSKETIRSKSYPELVKLENDMKRFMADRAEELATNEKRKGANLLSQGYLMNQLGSMRQEQITSIQLDNAFKSHRNELAKLGIYSSDHAALRVLIQASKRMNIDLGELLAEGAQNLKYLLQLGE